MTQVHEHKARILFIEWIRAFAAAAVVLLHVFQTPSSMYSVAELGTAKALAYTEAQVLLTRWAVPVFLMVTGALLLDPARAVGWDKQKKYIVRMVKVLASFGFAFCLIEAWINADSMSLSTLGTAVRRLLEGQSWSHMWYIYALLGVYLLLPLLRAFAASASRSDYRRLLVILFVFAFVVPAVNTELETAFTTLFVFSKAPFYVLLGRYVDRWSSFDRRILLAGSASAACAAGCAAASILAEGQYGLRFFIHSSPFLPLFAVMVFLVFKRLCFERPLPRVVAVLARNSFGIYIIHPVFMNLVYKAYPLDLPPVALEASVFLLALVGSVLATALLRRLPFFRSIL